MFARPPFRFLSGRSLVIVSRGIRRRNPDGWPGTAQGIDFAPWLGDNPGIELAMHGSAALAAEEA